MPEVSPWNSTDFPSAGRMIRAGRGGEGTRGANALAIIHSDGIEAVSGRLVRAHSTPGPDTKSHDKGGKKRETGAHESRTLR